jgi:23S rRNA (guanosine2251-2'-O)-methyltransferase
VSGRTERIYGWHAVQAFLASHPARIVGIRIAERREDPKVRALESAATAQRVPVARIERGELDRMLGDAVHQGVMADI